MMMEEDDDGDDDDDDDDDDSTRKSDNERRPNKSWANAIFIVLAFDIKKNWILLRRRRRCRCRLEMIGDCIVSKSRTPPLSKSEIVILFIFDVAKQARAGGP